MANKKVKRLDCRRCGVCCIADSPRAKGHPGVAGYDIARLPAELRDRIAWPTRQYPWPRLAVRHRNGRAVCLALVGRFGVDARCSIYRRRPESCRVFKPGCAACRESRRRYLPAASR